MRTSRPTPHHRPARLLIAMLVLSTAACGPLRRGNDVSPVQVVFRNDAPDQVTVYMTAGAMDLRRVATILSSRTETITVPQDIASRGEVNIVSRVLTRSVVASTGTVSIRPGERFDVRLSADGRSLTMVPARE